MINKKRLFEITEKAKDGDKASLVFNQSMMFLIGLNVVAVILASNQQFAERFSAPLEIIELVSVIIFTLEYLLRFWTARYKFPGKNFPYLRFVFSFMAMVDLLAILPFYLPLLFNVDLRFIRILRFFRLFRILKITRYNDSMILFGRVLKNEKEKLFITMFFLFILLLFASSIMYSIENPAQQEYFPDIISTLWWAMATLTTVGYGDVVPITPLGKMLGGIIAILGIGLVAMPSGIISSGLIKEIERNKTSEGSCPHCGKELGKK